MGSENLRVRMCLSYDGTDFFGWQKQPDQESTIQGLLEAKLSQIYNQPIVVVGSGRTDRGVHALKQWAHFDLPKNRNHGELGHKLQKMTPDSINIRSLEVAPPQFHAQASAISKCYSYRIQVSRSPSPFLRHWCWQRYQKIDISYLQEASQFLLGKQDFESFRSRGTRLYSTVRELKISRWVQKRPGFFEYQVKGDGFLKQMVRNIVGTLIVHQDQGRLPSAILEILKKKDRKQAEAPAPARGLFLTSVQYPLELDSQCRKL